MENNTSIIIFDSLMTIVLFVFASILVLTIAGWLLGVYYKFSGITRPDYLKDFLGRCVCALVFIGYVLGLFFQICYIGFENTEPINENGIPACIIQFHTKYPFDPEHEQYIKSILEAMDDCR